MKAEGCGRVGRTLACMLVMYCTDQSMAKSSQWW